MVFQVIQRKLIHVLTPATTSEGNIGPDAVHLLAIKEVNLMFCFSYFLILHAHLKSVMLKGHEHINANYRHKTKTKDSLMLLLFCI